MTASKRGRPPFQMNAKTIARAKELASQGMYEKDIAQCIGIHPSNLPELKRRHPELGEAIARGKSEGIANVSKHLMAAIEQRNVTAMIFYLKCNAGWRDSGPTESHVESSETSSGRRILELVRGRASRLRPDEDT